MTTVVVVDLDELVPAIEAAIGRALAAQELPSGWMTARHAAEHLGMTEAAVRRAAQRGEIPSVKLPTGRVRFDRNALDAWARSES